MIATGGSILTNAGKAITADAQANGINIEFTTIKIGGGELLSGVDPEGLTDLISVWKDIGITSIVKSGDDQVRIRGAFTNIGEVTENNFREVGVYAKTANLPETLFSYVNDGQGEVIPPLDTIKVERVRDIVSSVGNATDITINIDGSTIFATIYDLDEGLALKEDKFSKNTGFNKPFGNSPTEIMEGDKGTENDLVTGPELNGYTGTLLRTHKYKAGNGLYYTPLEDGVVWGGSPNPSSQLEPATWKRHREQIENFYSELINYEIDTETAGTHDLTKNIDPNYKFINIVTGSSPSETTKQFKLKTTDYINKRVLTLGVDTGVGNTENSIIELISNSQVSVNYQYVSGGNQVRLQKIYQSNI